jgi:hypothetical protein
MNDHDTSDPLESELRALSPHEPSPELRERIAERLAAEAMPARSRWRPRWHCAAWGGALAAGVVAACVMAAILLRREADPVAKVEVPAEVQQPLIDSAFDDALPSLWTYRRALARSAEELDALLDKHAGLARESNSQLDQVRAFARFDAEPYALPGEL